jgi:hypothetical protein
MRKSMLTAAPPTELRRLARSIGHEPHCSDINHLLPLVIATCSMAGPRDLLALDPARSLRISADWLSRYADPDGHSGR